LEAGERRVTIPYAKILASMIPPLAVRLRRDFSTVLNLIRAHALLHRATRQRDNEGRIIAEIKDYRSVRTLVGDLISEGVEASVPESIRQTVAGVEKLLHEAGGEVSVTQLASELRLGKSAVSRRVQAALDRGFLNNLETGRGLPFRLVLGDPLPTDVDVLPAAADLEREVLQCCSANQGMEGPV
jgi:hypothetical protein